MWHLEVHWDLAWVSEVEAPGIHPQCQVWVLGKCTGWGLVHLLVEREFFLGFWGLGLQWVVVEVRWWVYTQGLYSKSLEGQLSWCSLGPEHWRMLGIWWLESNYFYILIKQVEMFLYIY